MTEAVVQKQLFPRGLVRIGDSVLAHVTGWFGAVRLGDNLHLTAIKVNERRGRDRLALLDGVLGKGATPNAW